MYNYIYTYMVQYTLILCVYYTYVCTCRHTHIGTSKLPVLLKIHRGREILVIALTTKLAFVDGCVVCMYMYMCIIIHILIYIFDAT